MRNIHKLNFLAASVAVAVSGSVHAGELGAANEIFVGGATAPQNFMREDLLLRVCGNATTPKVFVDKVTVLPSTTPGGNILNAGDHAVVHCTADSTMPGALQNADIAVYKYNGGSATGVAPVVDPAASDPGVKTYLDASLATCVAETGGIGGANSWPIGSTSDTYELYVCDSSHIKTQAPDAGISDVEPTLFAGTLALDFGTEPFGVAQRPTSAFEDQGNLVIKPGPGLIFGTAVTLPMYDELLKDQQAAGMLPDCPANPTRAQKDSIACMPSLPSAAIRSVFTGQVTSWAQLAPYGQAMDTSTTSEGNNVHICKRTNGSGTHAQFSVNFMKTNCSATNNFSMLEQNDGISYAPAGFVGVYANSGSSDMDDCLRALGDGNGFDGDFDGLPQDTVANFGTGDSSVVPGALLDPSAGVIQTAGGNHPLGLTYANLDGSGVPQPFTAFGMGYNSMEKNTALTKAYRFVKVDGAAPTLEDAVAGDYRDIYYLSYQHRVVGGSADLQTGDIRTVAATQDQIDVADAYFSIWNATAPAAITAVNAGLIVDPDGISGTGDEWQGGYLSPIAGSDFAYSGNPATPWARQDGAGGADSCQDLGLVR